MAGKREKPADILTKPRQVKVLQGQGVVIADAYREFGVTQQTYYRWRKQYGRNWRIRSQGLPRSGATTIHKTQVAAW